MRKLFILFIFLFSILTFNKVKSQLPCNCTGEYTTETINKYLVVGNDSCLIAITYCNHHFKENTPGGTAVRAMSICSITFQNSCTLNIDLSSQDFWDRIFKLIIAEDASNELEGNIPYCNVNSGPTGDYTNVYYELTKAKCWILNQNMIEQRFDFMPCEGETATCWTQYIVCKGDDENLIIIETYSQIFGQSNCEFNGGTILNPNTFPFGECFDTCY